MYGLLLLILPVAAIAIAIRKRRPAAPLSAPSPESTDDVLSLARALDEHGRGQRPPVAIPVTVRSVGGGEAVEGTISLEYSRGFELDLSAPLNLDAKALIEIESRDLVRLGSVVRVEGSRVTAQIEHSMDRRALAKIHEAWNEIR